MLTGVYAELDGDQIRMTAADGFRLSSRTDTLVEPVDEPLNVLIPASAPPAPLRLCGAGVALLAARIEVYIDHTWRQDLTLGQMWSKVYGSNGYRASEGARLLALPPEQLVHEATGQHLADMDQTLVDELLRAAQTRLGVAR